MTVAESVGLEGRFVADVVARADTAPVTSSQVITTVLLVWFLLWFLRREVDSYMAFRAAQDAVIEYVGLDDLLDGDTDEVDGSEGVIGPEDPNRTPVPTPLHARRFRAAKAPTPSGMPCEPAYQFPGIPVGWSLDRYARDGIQQLTLHLVQSARRKP